MSDEPSAFLRETRCFARNETWPTAVHSHHYGPPPKLLQPQPKQAQNKMGKEAGNKQTFLQGFIGKISNIFRNFRAASHNDLHSNVPDGEELVAHELHISVEEIEKALAPLRKNHMLNTKFPKVHSGILIHVST